jgi:hypothetical protein
MKSFCQVSHAWYTAGIKQLYTCPELLTEHSLNKFVDTVSRSREAKVDFGSMVRVLRMGHLDHAITDMQLERLLPPLHASLISFEAPPASFGLDGLAALSMCKSLQQLDLSLLTDKQWTEDCVKFPDLKRAISGLPNLVSVSLPLKMALLHTDDSVGDWPASLRSIKLGGTLDPEVMRRFHWPSHPFKLTIRGCQNLNTSTLESIFATENIREFLVSLHISSINKMMAEHTHCGILYSLPNLAYLRMPLDLTEDFLVLPAGDHILPLQMVELTEPYFGWMQKDFTELLDQALHTNLCRVVSLGLCMIPSNLWHGHHLKIVNKLNERVQRTPQVEIEDIEHLGLWPLDGRHDFPAQ